MYYYMPSMGMEEFIIKLVKALKTDIPDELDNEVFCQIVRIAFEKIDNSNGVRNGWDRVRTKEEVELILQESGLHDAFVTDECAEYCFDELYETYCEKCKSRN